MASKLVGCVGWSVKALLRLQYPEMSLSQLAEKCDPPVTKSCMNHRMRKLLEEAKKL